MRTTYRFCIRVSIVCGAILHQVDFMGQIYATAESVFELARMPDEKAVLPTGWPARPNAVGLA
jgi:hypothetical protein